MGKSSDQTAGYRFKLRNHAGLTYGPLDAYLEFRGGEKTAWSGRQTTNGTIGIFAPKLWGGDKDQGGIVGNLFVMMGGADQTPNAMLVSAFGPLTAAWRGFATVAFDGLYGSNNPYPQPQSHKVEKILKGWDNDVCWYPEKAAIGLAFGFPGDTGTPDPVAVLPLADDFTDTVGNTWAPSSSTDPLNTHIVDGAAYFSGRFDGNEGAYLFCDANFGPLPEFCIRAKIKPSAGVYTQPLTIFSTDSGFQDIDFGLTPDLVLYAKRVSGGDGSPTFPQFFGTSSIPTDVETDVALIVEGGFATLYVNRVAQSSVEANTLVGEDVFRSAIGRSRGAQANFYVGTIRQFSITGPNPPSVFNGINPAHALYYLRTTSHKGGEPVESIDEASFTAAADQLYAEGFGICVRIDPDKESPEDVENRICKLIGGSVNRSLEDGKLHLDLARGNYVLADLPIVSDDDILSFSEQPTSPEGAVNSVSVRYFDPQRKEEIITPSVDALGLIDEFGLNHQVVEYPEIPTAALATRIATRELMNFITPSRVFDTACKPTVYALRPSQYFRLQAPKRGIADMVCIVGDRQSGTLKSGAIQLTAAQDIYTLPEFGSVDVDPGVNPTPPTVPVAITEQVAFEAPYVNVCATLPGASLATLSVDAGYLVAAAVDPAESRDFTLAVDVGAGYVERADGDWCPTAIINEAAANADPLPVDFTLSAGARLEDVAVGDLALWGNELCRVDALDAIAGTISLGRGCGDTVPQAHAAGERLWIYSEGAAYDPTEYSAGETVSAKLLTNSWSEQLDEAAAAALSLTFDQRQSRPYPPGQFQIDGSYYPAANAGGTGMSVTWSHRDRVLQADQLVDTLAASIGPEATVRYGLRCLDAATDALIIERVDLAGPNATVILNFTGDVTLQLYAISDNGESWQRHEHTLAYTPPAGTTDSTIDGPDYIPDTGEVIVDGNDPPPTIQVLPPTLVPGGVGAPGTPPTLAIGATVIDPCASPYNASPSATAAANAAAFNAAIAALPTGGGIVRPSVSGTYQIDTSNTIAPVSNFELDLETNQVRLKAAYSSTVTSPSVHRNIITINDAHDVQIRGWQMTGYRDEWVANGGAAAFGKSEWAHGIGIGNSTDVNIINLTVDKCVADAISIGRLCSNIYIGNFKTSNNRRQGISNGGDNVTVEDFDIGYIGGSDGTAPMSGIDNEVDDPATFSSENMIIRRGRLHHCSGPGLQFYKNCNNATVEDVVSEYNTKGIYAYNSAGVTVQGATKLRYNKYEGLHLAGTSSGWDVRADFFGNKTKQYGSPSGTTTTTTPTATQQAKHVTITSPAVAPTYDPTSTWGPI